jgi:signal transduction histidine kinase
MGKIPGDGRASGLDWADDTAQPTVACVRSITETVREPFAILDEHLRLLSANRAFYRTFRLSPQDTEGRFFYELGGHWETGRLRTLLEETAPGGLALDDFEIVHDLPGTGRKDLLLNARRLRLDGAERILLAIEDVTALRRAETQWQALTSQLRSERAHAEQALREREELIRRTLHSLPAHIAVLDGDGRIITVNLAWLAFAADNGAEEAHTVAVGADYLEICRRAAGDDAYARRSLEGIEAVLGGKLPRFTLDYPCDGPDQQRWFQMTVVPLGASGAGGAVVTHLDITERKQAELALREADRHKDQFLAMLAHELRNPLAPICTGLDLIQRQYADSEDLADTLRIMDSQLGHLVRLVDDLLDFSRIGQGKVRLRLERHTIAEIVDAALEMSDYALGDRRLTVEMPAEPLYTDGDRVRLVQVLANLLNNAVKFTNEDGIISLSAQRHGDRVGIRVCDDGLGIARDNLDRIFDMFVQDAPGQGSGIGIGLSLARNLVEMHGGTITAESPGPGGGATFTVWLPLCPEAPQQQVPQDPVENSSLAQHRVLVVDDNPEVADSLASLLTLLKAEVRVAYGGVEAIAVCEAWHPTHVLMDLGMPGMDGFEAARRLRARHPEHPFRLIAISGWGREEDRERARAAGFDQHFVKPVRVDELVAMLR